MVNRSTTMTKTRPSARKSAVSKPPSAPKTRERLAKFDIPFFTITAVLLAFGIVMMFSASYAFALREYGDSYHFFKKQLTWIAIGLVAMLVLSVIDYHILLNKKVVTIGVGISVALMLAVKLAGTTQGGAERWLTVFGITFQPSEILKFAIIILLAYITHKNASVIRNFFKGFVPFALCLGAACVLMVLQPHLSGTIIIFTIGIAMMVVSDCKISHIALLLVCLAVMAVIGITYLKAQGYTYFDDRILSWQNPEADTKDKTFQTYQSLIAIGSGGVFGQGLGNSRQKFYYLPATQNDFIFPIICEELGFVGAALVILLFVIFVIRGYYISSRARDRFGMMVGVGITTQIGVQALLNIAVATNSVPNTGISLPFFSYGGTALTMQLAQIGILLNISRKAAIE